jgi:lipoprotein-anchoring transpeptidase ErfK/SrfK
MIRFSAAYLLTLPVTAVLLAAPALAQQQLPSRIYEERLPPVMGSYDDDDEDVLPPPRATRPGQSMRGAPARVLPYPDEDPPLPPPTVLFGAPEQRPFGYGHQLDPQQQLRGPGAPSRITNDPDVIRPPGAVGTVPKGSAPSATAALPPEDQPETGKPKELPQNLKKQLVDFGTKEPAGTIIIDTPNTYLYLVLGGGRALRYGIGVGREGFTWAGTERISRMSEWPDWHPPAEMIDRQPYLPRFMAGGPGNPLGARALYLGKTLYRIHGTNQPSTIGSFVSSGCIRLLNDDIEDLFSRVQVGTRVMVYPGKPAEHVANTAMQPAAGGPAQAGTPANLAPPANIAPPVNAGAAPRNSSTAITASPLPPAR